MSTKSIAAVSKPTLITKDWQGKTFTFREDGYFNMTKAAKEFGKEVKDFFGNSSTADYCDELSCLIGENSPIKDISRGNGRLPHVGTWGHPKLAIFFSRWLDVRFSVACDMMIEDILRGVATVTIEKPEESSSLAYAEGLKAALVGQAEVSTQLLGLICQQSTANAKTSSGPPFEPPPEPFPIHHRTYLQEDREVILWELLLVHLNPSRKSR